MTRESTCDDCPKNNSFLAYCVKEEIGVEQATELLLKPQNNNFNIFQGNRNVLNCAEE